MAAWCEKLGKQEKMKRVQELMLEIFGKKLMQSPLV
jgi:hypothetical protein